ncbi:MAG: slipin family protein [Promethearchaeia archaeon]
MLYIVWIFLIMAIIFVLCYIASGIRVLAEYERAIVFRLGRFIGIKGPGLFWIIPGFDKTRTVGLRTITYDARMIKVITKDNIRCDIDSVVYYRVVDPKKAILEVENYTFATQNVAKTVLRDVFGMAELDEILSHTADFTLKIQEEVDKKTDPWGIKVSDVAVSDVLLPENMQRAIAKQAEAERERRSRIIIAEGESLAAKKMLEAAQIYGKSPVTLKLRELQTLTDIAKEKNLIVVNNTTDIKDLGPTVALTQAKKPQEKE